MKIAFYGGQTAGVITLLTLLASKQKIIYVIPEDKGIKQIAEYFSLTVTDRQLLDNSEYISKLQSQVDFLICCHGKKILSKKFVTSIRCINLHPCLYAYKGATPIQKLIADKNPKASVAAHWMTEKVDTGKVIVEEFINIENVENKTEAVVYNELYPLYIKVLLKILNDHEILNLEIMDKYLKQVRIRTTETKDCRSIWYIRNDPLVRQNSANTKPIPYTVHKQWLTQTLSQQQSYNYSLLLSYNGRKDKVIGYCRYELKRAKFDVSIALNAQYRLCGLGKYLLNNTLPFFINSKYDVTAKVKIDNYVSVNIFLSNNFFISRKDEIYYYLSWKRNTRC